MFRFLLLILIIVPCGAYPHKYHLSICAIFQNEAKWLPEWIEFHLKQGVEHFYLFDNLSTDSPHHALGPYGDKVTLLSWPYYSNNVREWNSIQNDAYNFFVAWYKGETKWVAFLDSDEFLFCPNRQNLNDFLREYQEFDAIGVNWILYGTSHVTIPKGEKMLKWLLWRSKLDFGANTHIKTIAKSDSIVNMRGPHCCNLKPNGLQVIENKVPFHGPFTDVVSVNRVRINHYWSRDLKYFHQVKLPRRLKWTGEIENWILFESYMNDVYDPILAGF